MSLIYKKMSLFRPGKSHYAYLYFFNRIFFAFICFHFLSFLQIYLQLFGPSFHNQLQIKKLPFVRELMSFFVYGNLLYLCHINKEK